MKTLFNAAAIAAVLVSTSAFAYTFEPGVGSQTYLHGNASAPSSSFDYSTLNGVYVPANSSEAHLGDGASAPDRNYAQDSNGAADAFRSISPQYGVDSF